MPSVSDLINESELMMGLGLSLQPNDTVPESLPAPKNTDVLYTTYKTSLKELIKSNSEIGVITFIPGIHTNKLYIKSPALEYVLNHLSLKDQQYCIDKGYSYKALDKTLEGQLYYTSNNCLKYDLEKLLSLKVYKQSFVLVDFNRTLYTPNNNFNFTYLRFYGTGQGITVNIPLPYNQLMIDIYMSNLQKALEAVYEYYERLSINTKIKQVNKIEVLEEV